VADREEMTDEQLLAIRVRLDEPPPLLALAERHQGATALTEYLRRLEDDRIALVDEIDRLRAEVGDRTPRRSRRTHDDGTPEVPPDTR
jgi:hypothetical protein